MTTGEPIEASLRTGINYWILALSYMALIYYFSSLHGDKLPSLSHGLDKLIHAGIYALLSLLIFQSLRKSGAMRHTFLLSLLLSFLYAVSDEFHQLYVPGRDASAGDLIADFIGIFIGSGFSYVMFRRGRKNV